MHPALAHDVLELLRKTIICAARHILPDAQPENVGVVVPPSGLDLLVLANSIETEQLVSHQITPQGGVRRGCVVAIGPKACEVSHLVLPCTAAANFRG